MHALEEATLQAQVQPVRSGTTVVPPDAALTPQRERGIELLDLALGRQPQLERRDQGLCEEVVAQQRARLLGMAEHAGSGRQQFVALREAAPVDHLRDADQAAPLARSTDVVVTRDQLVSSHCTPQLDIG